jgi:hypothetical protein
VLQSRDSKLKDSALEELVSLHKGTVLFVPAHTSMELHSAVTDGSTSCPLLAYAATANDHMFRSEMPAVQNFLLHHPVVDSTAGTMPEVQAPCALVADE